ncbi:MAG: alginate O-acetyltransferase [Alphaproteobacteria bacterium]|nr:alginate O-acetyltransferase [Alphaproteobacteria bacterium]
MPRYLPHGVAALLTLVMGAGMGAQAASNLELAEGPSVWDGTWQVAFERALDEALWLREPGVEAWAIFEYLAFGEGREGVLVGEDGWLYTDEEFVLHPDEAAVMAKRAELVERVDARLEAAGAELVVALIPAKARVYPEHLGRYRYPDYAQGRYEAFRGALVDQAVTAPDLVGPLSSEKATTPVFLRTDTHWTPGGARAVARAVAEAVKAELDVPGLWQTRYRLEPGETVQHEGDLLSFLPLGPLMASYGPTPDEVQLGEVVAEESSGGGGLGLFDEVDIPVTVTGSSYTDQAQWDFPGALRLALGADVLEAAEEGRGPFLPMLDYLEDDSFKQSPPALVVWEIPERFLATPLSDAELALLDGAER